MHPHLLACCVLICIELALPAALSAAEPSYTHEEALRITGVPRQAAEAALKCRAWLHALEAVLRASGNQRTLLLQIQRQDLLPLTALLYQTSFLTQLDEKTETLLVTVRLSRSPAAQSLTRLCIRNPELLWSSRHCLDEMTKLLRHADRHWPGARFYTGPEEKNTSGDPLRDPSPGTPPLPSMTWSRDRWLTCGRQLSALLTIHSCITPTGDGWFTQESSRKVLEQAGQDIPHDPLILLLLGEAELRSGNPHRSISFCSEALRHRPDSVRARYIRALAHWRLHQLGLAENDLSMALIRFRTEESPRDDWLFSLRARGAVRMLLGQIPEMCQDFEKACSLGDCDGLQHARQNNLCRTRTPERDGQDLTPGDGFLTVADNTRKKAPSRTEEQKNDRESPETELTDPVRTNGEKNESTRQPPRTAEDRNLNDTLKDRTVSGIQNTEKRGDSSSENITVHKDNSAVQNDQQENRPVADRASSVSRIPETEKRQDPGTQDADRTQKEDAGTLLSHASSRQNASTETSLSSDTRQKRSLQDADNASDRNAGKDVVQNEENSVPGDAQRAVPGDVSGSADRNGAGKGSQEQPEKRAANSDDASSGQIQTQNAGKTDRTGKDDSLLREPAPSDIMKKDPASDDARTDTREDTSESRSGNAHGNALQNREQDTEKERPEGRRSDMRDTVSHDPVHMRAARTDDQKSGQTEKDDPLRNSPGRTAQTDTRKDVRETVRKGTGDDRRGDDRSDSEDDGGEIAKYLPVTRDDTAEEKTHTTHAEETEAQRQTGTEARTQPPSEAPLKQERETRPASRDRRIRPRPLLIENHTELPARHTAILDSPRAADDLPDGAAETPETPDSASGTDHAPHPDTGTASHPKMKTGTDTGPVTETDRDTAAAAEQTPSAEEKQTVSAETSSRQTHAARERLMHRRLTYAQARKSLSEEGETTFLPRRDSIKRRNRYRERTPVTAGQQETDEKSALPAVTEVPGAARKQMLLKARRDKRQAGRTMASDRLKNEESCVVRPVRSLRMRRHPGSWSH